MTRRDDIYAQVPEVLCRGLCAAVCGPVPLHRAELNRVRAAAGYRVRAVGDGDELVMRPVEGLVCPLLKHGRCSVYEARPLICRLYGAAEGLECQWGCRPTGRLLTRAEAARLIDAMFDGRR